MNNLLTFFFVLLTAGILSAQIPVKILDGETNSPLPGATVISENNLWVADETGQIQAPPNTSVVVRFLGYREREVVLTTNTSIIRLYPDYLVLDVVNVNAYQENRLLSEVAGSYTRIPGRELQEGGPAAIVNAVSAIPGVRMEQRSPGSYRMNIRGSTLRSPFGVRNVKIYYNQIPITEPNGNTPLNLIDLDHLSSVSIIRTPAASSYGAGTGGVMLLSGEAEPSDGFSGQAELAAGSFGYNQAYAGLQFRNEDGFTRVFGGLNTADGYREHTRLERKNAGLIGEFAVSDKQKISYTLLYNDIYYQLPGGLNKEQRDDDPTQARQIAIDQQSSIDQHYFIAGINHHYEWQPNSGNETAIFWSSANKDNPFITNYEFEDLSGSGIRTRFFHQAALGTSTLRLSAGGEWQWGNFKASNFGNADGYPDTLRYVDDTRMFTGFEFVQAELDAGDWNMTAGLSVNHLTYEFNRLRDVALDSAYRVDRTFRNTLRPRLGLVYNPGNVSAFVNLSWGYSPPTQDEVRTSDGGINTALEAEEAMSIETGIRSEILPGRLYAELILFRILQNNTIVSRVDEFGNSLFRNSGETLQQGLELSAAYNVFTTDAGLFRKLEVTGSLSWNDLTFREYTRASGGENVDFSGNDLTGGVPLTYFTEVTVATAAGIRLNLSHQFTDKIPLNDENTVYSRPYHLVRARLRKSILFRNGTGLILYVGADNLLNERYSLGNDLNAFGARYFNPSAERNYYGGIQWKF